MIASAKRRRKRVKEKRITLDQTLSPKKLNDLLNGVNMINDEAFQDLLQNRHVFDKIQVRSFSLEYYRYGGQSDSS